jgi:hypothetical protein
VRNVGLLACFQWLEALSATSPVIPCCLKEIRQFWAEFEDFGAEFKTLHPG